MDKVEILKQLIRTKRIEALKKAKLINDKNKAPKKGEFDYSDIENIIEDIQNMVDDFKIDGVVPNELKPLFDNQFTKIAKLIDSVEDQDDYDGYVNQLLEDIDDINTKMRRNRPPALDKLLSSVSKNRIDKSKRLYEQFRELEKMYPDNSHLYTQLYNLYSKMQAPLFLDWSESKKNYLGRVNTREFIEQKMRDAVDINSRELLQAVYTKFQALYKQFEEEKKQFSENQDVEHGHEDLSYILEKDLKDDKPPKPKPKPKHIIEDEEDEEDEEEDEDDEDDDEDDEEDDEDDEEDEEDENSDFEDKPEHPPRQTFNPADEKKLLEEIKQRNENSLKLLQQMRERRQLYNESATLPAQSVPSATHSAPAASQVEEITNPVTTQTRFVSSTLPLAQAKYLKELRQKKGKGYKSLYTPSKDVTAIAIRNNKEQKRRIALRATNEYGLRRSATGGLDAFPKSAKSAGYSAHQSKYLDVNLPAGNLAKRDEMNFKLNRL